MGSSGNGGFNAGIIPGFGPGMNRLFGNAQSQEQRRGATPH